MAMQLNTPVPSQLAGYRDAQLLRVATHNNTLGKWSVPKVIPPHQTMTMLMHTYELLTATPKTVAEFITPGSTQLVPRNVQFTLSKIGDWIENSEEAMISHMDNLYAIETERLGQQADQMIDLSRAGILMAGTNAFFSNGIIRSSVNTVLSIAGFKAIRKAFARSLATRLTSMIVPTDKVGTSPINAAYIAVCHSDLQNDFELLTSDYIPIHKYANQQGILPGEIGSLPDFRIVVDNNLAPIPDAGGTKGSMASTGGTNADVYPILIFSKDAYVTGSLGGEGSIKMHIVDPTKDAAGNPLGQRGSIGWTAKTGTVITNDPWLARFEVACTA